MSIISTVLVWRLVLVFAHFQVALGQHEVVAGPDAVVELGVADGLSVI